MNCNVTGHPLNEALMSVEDGQQNVRMRERKQPCDFGDFPGSSAGRLRIFSSYVNCMRVLRLALVSFVWLMMPALPSANGDSPPKSVLTASRIAVCVSPRFAKTGGEGEEKKKEKRREGGEGRGREREGGEGEKKEGGNRT